MKNTVEGMKSRLDEAEDQISELEEKVEKNTQKEQEKEKRLRKNEEVIREVQDNMKHNNTHIIRILEGEEEQGVGCRGALTQPPGPPWMKKKTTKT